MMNPDPSDLDEWLQALNRKQRQDEVPPNRRPFDAVVQWSSEQRSSVSLSSPLAETIFAWYRKHTKPGVQLSEPQFIGVLYFDVSFWPLIIPVIYGTVNFDICTSLSTMPPSIKRELASYEEDLSTYTDTWTNCLDYALGFDDVGKLGPLTQLGAELFRAGDKELRSAVDNLLLGTPNSDAMFRTRSATEKFLKVLLVDLGSYSGPQIRRDIGHDLSKAVREAASLTANSDVVQLDKRLSVYPRHTESYKGQERDWAELWDGYRVAQLAGAAVTREFTDRDSRGAVSIG